MTTIVGAVISGTCTILVALIGLFGARRLREIHVLVNSQMVDAIAHIDRLETALAEALDSQPGPSPPAGQPEA